MVIITELLIELGDMTNANINVLEMSQFYKNLSTVNYEIVDLLN